MFLARVCLVGVLVIWGCSKPAPRPVRKITVTQTCKVPPMPSLPTAHAYVLGDKVCMSKDDAKKAATRDGMMKDWIRTVYNKCYITPEMKPQDGGTNDATSGHL